MAKVIAIANQKGGVGKTTTAVNLGIGLVNQGKRVLLVDTDSQGSLSISLGIINPDECENTIHTAMLATIDEDENYDYFSPVVHNEEGVDFIPANVELAGLEVTLVNVMMREFVLANLLDNYKADYDYIILDCMPSLGMITINALVASNEVIIPTQAQYLSAKGLEMLLRTISMVKKRLNRNLEIKGILITMVHAQSTFQKEIKEMLTETYKGQINIFETSIPSSVKVSETTALGKSIYQHDNRSKVSIAYKAFTDEIIS